MQRQEGPPAARSRSAGLETLTLLANASLDHGYESGVKSEAAQSCPTLCDPKDCSPAGSSVHGIFQARVLESVAVSCSRGSSRPRDRTCVSMSPASAGGVFTTSATGEALHRKRRQKSVKPPGRKQVKCMRCG